MWPTIKLHNFLRSTSFILIVSTSESVYKIWIFNLKNSHGFLNDKMISNQKVDNYKVSLHFNTYNFYFGGFSIRGSLKNSKFKHSFAWHDDFKPKHCQPHITLQYWRRGNSLARWRNAPTLNPKMRRGLNVLPDIWIQDEHKNTQGFRVVQATGA
jgi:hypothetical protein